MELSARTASGPTPSLPAHLPQRELQHALTAARECMARGTWTDARAQLQLALGECETAEALEDLGLVAWWLDDQAELFASRERAYAIYRDRHDDLGAARMAIWLVWDNLAFRGDFAVASGWLERARRLLAGSPESAEYGWLLIREGEVALFRGHDPASAVRLGAEAALLGRHIGDGSVEFTALALEGLARVSMGDVSSGMRCLDEAAVAATAGEMPELHAVGLVCCWQIFACERLSDYDRAVQWCARVQEFTRRWGLRPLAAVCRTQYASVLMWHGDWIGAESELVAAAKELERARPGLTGPALARLGQLRLRQGRADEAAALFERSSAQPLSRLGLATLLLQRGAVDECAASLEQQLSTFAPDETTARVAVLELLVRALAMRAVGRDGERVSEQVHEETRAHLAELERTAMLLGTDPLHAAASAARAVVLQSRGQTTEAIAALGTAVEHYLRSGACFDTATARIELAGLLAGAGRTADAERHARAAVAVLEGLGARTEAGRARAVLRACRGSAQQTRRRDVALTARQVEILRLVARGMHDAEIAERLGLSAHTVKRHVANVLARLQLPSRAAATAHAAQQGLL